MDSGGFISDEALGISAPSIIRGKQSIGVWFPERHEEGRLDSHQVLNDGDGGAVTRSGQGAGIMSHL
jgi:hypothetical protein